MNWDTWRHSGTLRVEQLKGLDFRSSPIEIPAEVPRGDAHGEFTDWTWIESISAHRHYHHCCV